MKKEDLSERVQVNPLFNLQCDTSNEQLNKSVIPTKSLTQNNETLAKINNSSLSYSSPQNRKKLFIILRGNNSENINKKFKCSHSKCVSDPLTLKQIIAHHDKIDHDCKKEKKLLYKLIDEFILASNDLFKSNYLSNDVNNYNINIQNEKNLDLIKYIKNIQYQYDHTLNATLDKDKFLAIIKEIHI